MNSARDIAYLFFPNIFVQLYHCSSALLKFFITKTGQM